MSYLFWVFFLNLCMEKNISKVRAHDAIVGMTYFISVVGSMFVNANLILLALGIGFLQIISPFTKFCPVYFILNKMMPDTEPFQNGKIRT